MDDHTIQVNEFPMSSYKGPFIYDRRPTLEGRGEYVKTGN